MYCCGNCKLKRGFDLKNKKLVQYNGRFERKNNKINFILDHANRNTTIGYITIQIVTEHI